MASSCSFRTKYRGEYTTYSDQICFAPLLSRYTKGKKEIIIEKEKRIFSMSRTREFLRDLKKMGFKFNYRLSSKDDNIYITTGDFNNDNGALIVFTTILRCLWEGEYDNGKKQECNKDLFTETIKHYFNLKRIFKDKYNETQRFCIAINCYYKGNVPSFVGHYFSNMNYNDAKRSMRKVNILDTLSNYKTFNSVYDTFRLEGAVVPIYPDKKYKYARNWNTKTYEKFIKELS